MTLADLQTVIIWWGMFFFFTLLFWVFTAQLFYGFFDKGYIFSKIIGALIVSYIVYVLGTIKWVPFTQINVILIAVFSALLFTYPFKTKLKRILSRKQVLQLFKKYGLVFVIEELLFFALLSYWSFVRGNAPDIHGLEKYMDFGFVNSILRSDFFPAKDMWFTPFSINYYYFGHVITAVLTKISAVPSHTTYNLMIATLFAFTFACSFSIGANLINQLRNQNAKVKSTTQNLKIFIGGLLAGFLVSFSGNLHTIYSFFKPYTNESPVPFWNLEFLSENSQSNYWYPNATRFIYNTIHEFPLYSFVVSDLHGHVLSIPIVLTIIALAFHELKENSKKIRLPRLLFMTFLISLAYMTNASDGAIYLLLTVFLIISILWRTKKTSFITKVFFLNVSYYTLIVFVGFFLFSLPFSLFFKPFVSGIGVLCAPPFLTKIGKLGPFLFEADHCQKSPLWQLAILYGFFYFSVFSFFIFLFVKKNHQTQFLQFKKTEKQKNQKSTYFNTWNLFRNLKLEIRNLSVSDFFVLILIFLSTLLIIIPEFIYIKDIYPAHYRANTMFKLVYQAFIMLSLASAYALTRITAFLFSKFFFSSVRFTIGSLVWIIIAGSLIYLVGLYPSFAVKSFYGELKAYKGLNGTAYLQTLHPSDYAAIQWINKTVKNQPVILEAQGDSYTDYGRFSVNTGLPTVLGWTVHEWLWRGSYAIPEPRVNEVKTIYETNDLRTAKKLLRKYQVRFVVVGNLEKEKYPLLKEDAFKKLGKVVFSEGATKIYQIR